MPYKDPEKARAYEIRRQKEVYNSIRLQIRKDSDEWTAIISMQKITGKTAYTYAREALRERLIREGFLSGRSK